MQTTTKGPLVRKFFLRLISFGCLVLFISSSGSWISTRRFRHRGSPSVVPRGDGKELLWQRELGCSRATKPTPHNSTLLPGPLAERALFPGSPFIVGRAEKRGGGGGGEREDEGKEKGEREEERKKTTIEEDEKEKEKGWR